MGQVVWPGVFCEASRIVWVGLGGALPAGDGDRDARGERAGRLARPGEDRTSSDGFRRALGRSEGVRRMNWS